MCIDPQVQCCPNEGCRDTGRRGGGNIRVHGRGERRYRCTTSAPSPPVQRRPSSHILPILSSRYHGGMYASQKFGIFTNPFINQATLVPRGCLVRSGVPQATMLQSGTEGSPMIVSLTADRQLELVGIMHHLLASGEGHMYDRCRLLNRTAARSTPASFPATYRLRHPARHMPHAPCRHNGTCASRKFGIGTGMSTMYAGFAAPLVPRGCSVRIGGGMGHTVAARYGIVNGDHS